MRLIKDWKDAWRWMSVRCMVLSSTVVVAWEGMPADLKASLPQNLMSVICVVLMIFGIVGRITLPDPKKRRRRK